MSRWREYRPTFSISRAARPRTAWLSSCTWSKGAERRLIAAVTTNADGRTDAPLISGDQSRDRHLRALIPRRRLLSPARRDPDRSALPGRHRDPHRRRELGRQLSRPASALSLRVQHLSRLMTPIEQASEVIRWCRQLAKLSDDRSVTTRTFLSAPMREVHTRARSLDGAHRHDRARRRRRKHPWHISPGALSDARRGCAAPLHRLPSRHCAECRGVRRRARRRSRQSRSSRCWTRSGFPLRSKSSGSRTRKACASACRSSAAARWRAHSIDALLDRTDGSRANPARRDSRLRPRSEPHPRCARAGQRDRLSRVPHRAGAGARQPQPSARRRRHDLRAEPRRCHVHRYGRARGHDADEDAQGCARLRRRSGSPKSSGEALTTPGWSRPSVESSVEPGAGNVVPERCVASLDVRHPADSMRKTAIGRLSRAAEEIASPTAV